ncbi:MAG: SMP-30/gluconolactonase/LRE family protein [Salinarimonadaceae bacterium]|nr:MAG: SMP-30/gluconolactonase/LRE family protein [Salinarimonadaceae bacterium]
MTSLEAIDAPPSALGEGPFWSVRDNALFWVDVVGRLIFRYRPGAGAAETRQLPYAPSAILPFAKGGFLLVTKKGMALFDFDSGAVDSVPVPLVDFSQEVFNDAACDRMGRLWVGTRDKNLAEPKGRLYRMDPDFSMSVHGAGYTVSNGITFSPDSRLMYHVDSRPGRIHLYDYDLASGEITGRSIFLEYAHETHGHGHPDGCTVDADGGLWVAEVEGWRVARYLPDGGLDRVIDTPFRKPTSVMFGGDDLATLFVTSMQFGLSETELAEQVLAGRVLAADMGVRGLPEPMFGAPSP